MSNIYVQEPPTDGKVIVTTTLGEIEIELWSKECPKACRNFVQLCLENFFNGTIFHRVVPNFIAQGGDPTGSGHGGESIYGGPFKNEIHSRLRFVRRGLVATANTGNNDNESQFFFTLGATPELQNKHTIFGRVAGNTLFNMIKFNDLDIDNEERPRHPPKILKTDVINNPFPDIEPRVSEEKKPVKEESKSAMKGTKNRKLLSFADEEDEEEDELVDIPATKKFKGKSSHDLTNDPKLSSVPALETDSKSSNEKDSATLASMNSSLQEQVSQPVASTSGTDTPQDDDRQSQIKKKLDDVKKQIKLFKKGLKSSSENQDQPKTEVGDSSLADEDGNDVLKEFHEQKTKYATAKATRLGKGSDREAETLLHLQKFKKMLTEKRSLAPAVESDEDSADTGSSWLAHNLKFEDKAPTLARDANTKDDDWFEIYDPRNPINKRRREESKRIMKEKGAPKNSL